MRVVELARREFRGVVAALAFLTRLPVGRAIRLDEADVARAAPAFPLVGGAIGAAAASCGVLLVGHVATMVAAALALIVAVGLTGGLHLDGLADSADAIGARSRDHALAIMRDPRVGSYGLAAVVLALLVEAGALGALITARRVADVAVAFALSRAVAPVIAAALPYARPGSGLARSLVGGLRRAAAGALVAIALAAVLAPHHGWWLIVAAGACAIASAAFSSRRFGGITGDTLGASIVLTEAICLIVASAR
jgi:adenosylcobinamide-GDP ribazoletransferase